MTFKMNQSELNLVIGNEDREEDGIPQMPFVVGDNFPQGIPNCSSDPFFFSSLPPPPDSIIDVEENCEITDEILIKYAKEGQFHQLRNTLQIHPNANINATDEDGSTILHHACLLNNISTVCYLIERGVNVNAKDAFGRIPLHFIARNREFVRLDASVPNTSESNSSETVQENIIRQFVEAKVHLNCQDDEGKTPLHYAAQGEKVELTAALLKCRRTSLYIKSNTGEIPLHIAAKTGSIGVCELLLNHFYVNELKSSQTPLKDLSTLDNLNQTPLHKASENGYLEIVDNFVAEATKRSAMGRMRLLINKSLDVERKTPLILAAENGHYELTGYLLKHTDPRSLEHTGASILHYAAWVGDDKILRMFFKDREKNLLDNDNRTPLHYAARKNKLKSIEFLLEKGVNVEIKDIEGLSPLLLAARNGFKETVNILIQGDSDITTMCNMGRNILHHCVANGHIHLLQYLLNHEDAADLIDLPDNEGNTPLQVAVMEGETKISQFLINDVKAKIDVENKRYDTPLSLAAQCGFPDIVQCILRKESALQLLFQVNHRENTPLHIASSSGNKAIVQMLLNSGADVRAMNINKMSPLMCAAENGHDQCCKRILDKKNTVNDIGREENTALHLAAKQGHVQVVKVLLEYGGDLSILNKVEKNPLEVAIAEGQEKVVMTIIKSDQWETALRKIRMREKGHRSSPFRDIIERYPKAAETILDRCYSVDKTKQICKVNFEFVEDTCISYDRGQKSAKTTPYTKNFSVVQKNHPLNIMIEHNQTNLIGHIVCKELIKYKWRRFGKKVYFVNLSLYLLYLMALTLYILLSADETYVERKCEMIQAFSNCSFLSCQEVLEVLEGEKLLVLSNKALGLQLFVIVTASINLLKETVQMYLEFKRDKIEPFAMNGMELAGAHSSLLKRFQPIKFRMFTEKLSYINLQNMIELISFSFAIALAVDMKPNLCSVKTAWQWRLGTIAIFFSWCDLILRIRKFPTLGIYVVMLLTVFKTFCKFFIVFFLFLLTFALSFYMVFRSSDSFYSIESSIFKTSVMTIGDLDFRENFKNNSDPFAALSHILFGLFLILMPILIMNLLVGLAVDDIKTVLANAKLKRLAMKVKLLMDIEVEFLKYWMNFKKFQEIVYITELTLPWEKVMEYSVDKRRKLH